VRIVSVGRLVEKNGIEDAIVALSLVGAPFEYLVAGDGPLRTHLEDLARRRLPSGSVRFLGAQTHDEIVPLLQSADICLAPSMTGADGDIEGIPVAIMEAMAAGLAVVSTRHSGIPELVVHGVSGLLVEERDTAALAAAVSALVADSRQRSLMGAAGRAIVAADYDVAVLTDRLVDLYREAIDGPR
jgi:colanic acid/amylovoran biosynthesis glycosyltransferase